MFVGDHGKILAGFQGANPEILPAKKMDTYIGDKIVAQQNQETRTETWVKAIKSPDESPGSFIYAGPVTDMMNLGSAALRAGKRLEFDSENIRITNDESANQFLTRDYRKGWEI